MDVQDSGELTPSMKIKRRVLTTKYAAVIDELLRRRSNRRAGNLRADAPDRDPLGASPVPDALHSSEKRCTPRSHPQHRAENNYSIDAQPAVAAPVGIGLQA